MATMQDLLPGVARVPVQNTEPQVSVLSQILHDHGMVIHGHDSEPIVS